MRYASRAMRSRAAWTARGGTALERAPRFRGSIEWIASGRVRAFLTRRDARRVRVTHRREY